MRFSQRKGYVPIRDVIQIESMDDPLRNSLWNILDDYYLHSDEHFKGGLVLRTVNEELSLFARSIWTDFLNLPADQRLISYPKLYEEIKKYFFEFEWFEVYDFF